MSPFLALRLCFCLSLSPIVVLADKMASSLVYNNPDKSRRTLYIAVSWPSHPATAAAFLPFSKFHGRKADKDHFERVLKETNDLRAKKPAAYWSVVRSELELTDKQAASTLGEIVSILEAPAKDSPLAPAPVDTKSLSDLPDSVVQKVIDFAGHLDPEAEQPGTIALIDSDASTMMRKKVLGQSADSSRGMVESTPASPPWGMQNIGKWIGSLLFLVGLMPSPQVVASAKAVTDALEFIFFDQFQRRASVCGQRGVNNLITRLMEASEKHGTRFHAISHSMGGHVVCSAVIGVPDSPLPRMVHSLSLLQAAIPSNSCAPNEPYHVLHDGAKRVSGPIIASTSQFDMALDNYSCVFPIFSVCELLLWYSC
jgi:hypothetical protein